MNALKIYLEKKAYLRPKDYGVAALEGLSLPVGAVGGAIMPIEGRGRLSSALMDTGAGIGGGLAGAGTGALLGRVLGGEEGMLPGGVLGGVSGKIIADLLLRNALNKKTSISPKIKTKK